ncbi:MAG TPA: hypothetical protein VMV86_02690 [Methanosarcinales archaeon]|nr:hypothetical protein [Methanosarcinales archaeon]
MLAVAVNYTDFKNPLQKLRQKTAIEVLDANKPDDCRLVAFSFPDEDVSGLPTAVLTHRTLTRDSSELIGNNRRLPYISQILDKASIYCDRYFGFVNSDILLTKEFFNVFDTEYDAYIFYRTEIAEVTTSQFLKGDIQPIYGGDSHEGCDAFFFNKGFWLSNRTKFNRNLIVGETEWDTFYRYMIAANTDHYYVGRDLYHVYHDAKWDTKSKGAQNNAKIWEEFYDSVGKHIKVKEP